MAKSKLVPLRIFPVLALALGQYASAQTPRLSRTEAEKRADAPLIKMTLDEKLVGGIDDFYTQAVRRLAIQQVRMSDGPLGVHDYGPTTAYPAPIALTASWDLDLARRVAENMSKDGRARGVHFIVAPGLNIYRAPITDGISNTSARTTISPRASRLLSSRESKARR